MNDHSVLSADTDVARERLYNKHRIEALSDGIIAVAMTLLVIDLKLPKQGSIASYHNLINAVVHLILKLKAWLISCFMLTPIWLRHHRLRHYVRHVDGKLLAYCLLQLGFVSLMPFSSALSGEYTPLLFSQIFYSVNMTGLALTALLIGRHVYGHHELTLLPMPAIVYEGIRIRTGGLVIIGIAAIVIASFIPNADNIAFMLMMPIGTVARRMEAREAKRALAPSAIDSST